MRGAGKRLGQSGCRRGPGAGWEGRPGAMETRLQPHKCLTSECEGRSRAPRPLSRRTPRARASTAPRSSLQATGRLLGAATPAGLPFYVFCGVGGRGRGAARGCGADLGPGGPRGTGCRRGVAGAGGLHAGAMDTAALLGLPRLCALWAALLALFPSGAQGNWM